MHAGASVHPVQTSRSSHSVKPGNMYAAVATRNFPTTYMEANGLDARPHLHILHMLSLNTLSQNHVSMAKCPSSDQFIPFSQKNIPENIPKNIGPRTLSYYLTLAPPPPASPLFSSDKPSSPGSDFYIVQQPPKQPTSKPCLSIPSLLPLARQGSSQLGKFHVYFRLVSPPPPTIHRPGDFARACPRFPAVQRFTQDLLCFGCFFVRGGQSVRVSNVDPVDRPRSRAIPLPAQLPHLDRAGHAS